MVRSIVKQDDGVLSPIRALSVQPSDQALEEDFHNLAIVVALK